MPTPEEIQTCINNLTPDSQVTEMVILSAETNDVTTDRSIAVADINSLPDLSANTISVGTVFFVQSIGIPVVAGVGSWEGIDGRILRQDYPAADVWTWGSSSDGRLGDNALTDKSSPVSVVGGFTDWASVSLGRDHALAVRQNGTAWAWGLATCGVLGDNSVTNKSSPVSVVGGFTDWCQVSAGDAHSLGVRQDGTAWAWGRNTYGRLGDNSVTNKFSPVSVVGGFTDWCQISAGSTHSLAVKQDGTAWAWGRNNQGQLGDNTIVDKSSPVSVVGGFTDWCQISAGAGSQSLAVRQNGTAWGWGNNSVGILGDNSVVSKSSPVSVVGGITDWCHVSAGANHSLGLRQGGTAWAWGNNSSGQLGINTTVSRSTPGQIVGIADWCQISAGSEFSLAVRQSGTIWSWGSNGSGQLGNCNTTNRSSPGLVVGGFVDWCQVSGGRTFSAGLRRY